jgi:DNA (cytosine-5)-methyltransferase 1
MMRDGQVFELQMPELLIKDLEFSYLRSPKASEGEGGALGEAEAMKRGNTVGVRDQVMDLVAAQGEKVSRVSVPTPTATDGSWDRDKVQRKVTAGSMNRGVDLPLWAKRINEGAYLLPTANTMDDLPARDESKIDRSKGGFSNVRETVVRPNFDRFEPVVKRWEQVTGMEAPAPTKPDGKDGAHRLSSEFTEWMMGLPKGWITSLGLSRKDELKACGNGVVPQQAQLALRLLMDGK